MRTYIFATDFSDNAHHALAFAVPFIKKLGGQLLLFHAYEYADPIVGVPLTITEEMNREKEGKVRKQLILWKKKVKELDPDLPCKYIARRLPFVSTLLNLARETDAGGIFMGTKGASGIKQLIMGSNTASVLEKASCPVYAIPDSGTFSAINSIVYATDYQEENAFILTQIEKIARVFEAKVEILYVAVENSKLDMEVYEWYQEAVKEKLAKLEVSFKVIKEKNVQAGISKYVETQNPDLVVMAMHRKNWIGRILKSSYTRKQVFHTQKPLLILQSDVRERAMA